MATMKQILTITLILATQTLAFVALRKHSLSCQIHRNIKSTSTTLLEAKQTSSKKQPVVPSCEFELQELRANLSVMRQRGYAAVDLTPDKSAELKEYVDAIVAVKGFKNSPISMQELAANPSDYLLGEWRLSYSSEDAQMSGLPREARVYLDIKDGSNLDYKLKFKKGVQGLRDVCAKSTYSVDPGPLNPGLLTFQYGDITAKVFGMDMPVGMFGLLKGRANYIETAYFDQFLWIERGYSNVNGELFYNVYTKEVTDPWKSNKEDVPV